MPCFQSLEECLRAEILLCITFGVSLVLAWLSLLCSLGWSQTCTNPPGLTSQMMRLSSFFITYFVGSVPWLILSFVFCFSWASLPSVISWHLYWDVLLSASELSLTPNKLHILIEIFFSLSLFPSLLLFLSPSFCPFFSPSFPPSLPPFQLQVLF